MVKQIQQGIIHACTRDLAVQSCARNALGGMILMWVSHKQSGAFYCSSNACLMKMHNNKMQKALHRHYSENNLYARDWYHQLLGLY